ncbi:MAG: HU family DNA-binding protein [Clostridia bacterium]|jgi:DNA-binding protein HU-beta|nr:HU family DNA-binding protein [Clostridia bacterium]
MTKPELVKAVATEAEMTNKDAEKAVNAMLEVITDALVRGEKVQLIGFGTFEISERAAREGRNPQTGESVHIEASRAPKFKAGKALKDALK